MKSLTLFIVLSLPLMAFGRPTAVLPNDTSVSVGEEVSIDASSSFDEDGESLSYRWNLDIVPENFNSQIDSPTNSSIQFTANAEGFYLIRLIVNNGTENSSPAYMVIRATP